MPQKKYLFPFLMFTSILLIFSSGCSKPVIKSEKEEISSEENIRLIEKQKKDAEINILVKQFKAKVGEAKKLKNDLEEISNLIYIYTVKDENTATEIKNDRYQLSDRSYNLRNNKKNKQIKYDSVSIDLKIISEKLEALGYETQKLIGIEKITEPEKSSEIGDKMLKSSTKERFLEEREVPDIINNSITTPAFSTSMPSFTAIEKIPPEGIVKLDATEKSFDKEDISVPTELKISEEKERDAIPHYAGIEAATEKTPPPEKRIPLKTVYSSGSGLKAGYSDDNKQFNYFIDYLNKFQSVEHYPTNIGERIILKVKDLSGNSMPNAEVMVYAKKDLIANGITYSDGSFILFPSEYANNIPQYRVVINYMYAKKEIPIQRYGKREIEVRLDYQKDLKENVPIDILFIGSSCN